MRNRPPRRRLGGNPNLANVAANAQEDSAIDGDGVFHRGQVASNRHRLDAERRMNARAMFAAFAGQIVRE
jgi:hypothetical protein